MERQRSNRLLLELEVLLRVPNDEDRRMSGLDDDSLELESESRRSNSVLLRASNEEERRRWMTSPMTTRDRPEDPPDDNLRWNILGKTLELASDVESRWANVTSLLLLESPIVAIS